MNTLQQRTARDPEAFVAELNGTQWGGKTLRVELVSIDGETPTGRKRFTIRISDEEPFDGYMPSNRVLDPWHHTGRCPRCGITGTHYHAGMNEQQRKYVADVLERIRDEAAMTAPMGMSDDEAVSILITDRVERHILNEAEGDEAQRMARGIGRGEL